MQHEVLMDRQRRRRWGEWSWANLKCKNKLWTKTLCADNASRRERRAGRNFEVWDSVVSQWVVDWVLCAWNTQPTVNCEAAQEIFWEWVFALSCLCLLAFSSVLLCFVWRIVDVRSFPATPLSVSRTSGNSIWYENLTTTREEKKLQTKATHKLDTPLSKSTFYPHDKSFFSKLARLLRRRGRVSHSRIDKISYCVREKKSSESKIRREKMENFEKGWAKLCGSRTKLEVILSLNFQ